MILVWGRLDCGGGFNLLVYYIEMVLIAEKTPDDGHVFHDDIEGYGEKGPDKDEERATHPHSVQREGLDDPEDVHVNVHGPHKGADEVDERRAGNRSHNGQHNVGGSEWQGDPRVEGDPQKDLFLPFDIRGVNNQVNTLHPTLSLLQEVPHGKR